MPSQTESRAGSESGAAAGRGCQDGAAAHHWQPLPEPLAGGTTTLQEILDTVRAPSDVVESDELSLPDLARDNDDWDSEAEDQPDPGELQS